MTKGDEIRGLVREIENRVEAGILPDGNCIFDPLRVEPLKKGEKSGKIGER